MLRNSKTAIPYDEIDYEIKPLIKYINNVDGIETCGCCCGHGVEKAHIELLADNIEDLNKFMYKYFYGNYGWQLSLCQTDVDIGNWNRLHFILHTTDLIDYKYVYLSIRDVTKTFFIRQHGLTDEFYPDYEDKEQKE